MGRRALRKIDPNLDYTPYLCEAKELPRPWDALALFSEDRPLEVEVGSGKGLFLESAAPATPEHNFLGIEIAGKYARYIAARLARREARNAKAVHGDAQSIFEDYLPEESVHAVHVYFPDPWWKKRHHKRRIMNSRFVKQIERVLVPQGTLHFWTDVQPYFELAVETLQTATRLQGPFEVAEQEAEHDLDYRTHFERRTRQAGDPVFRAVFHKLESTD